MRGGQGKDELLTVRYLAGLWFLWHVRMLCLLHTSCVCFHEHRRCGGRMLLTEIRRLQKCGLWTSSKVGDPGCPLSVVEV